MLRLSLLVVLTACQSFGDMRCRLDEFPLPEHLVFEKEEETGLTPRFAGSPHASVNRYYHTERHWKQVCDELITLMDRFGDQEYVNWRDNGCSVSSAKGSGLRGKLLGTWSYRVGAYVRDRAEKATYVRISVVDLG
jgi:hypothetical protein